MNLLKYLQLLSSIHMILGSQATTNYKKPHTVVIGGGFAGWGAAKALCENGCKVTLLDAGEPTGREPYLTKSGKPFEAGHKGFWRDYPNIYDLISNDLKLNEDDIFTPYTNSSFYSPYGLEATAPVFSSSSFPILPSPLGQIVASVKLFERLPFSDRLTMVGLLIAMLDYDRNEEVYAAYDRMTAHDLFIRFGLSKRLVDDFITPTLLVGLFKPPEELSAAIIMDLLYFYALAHQTSFDVRWIKKGSIAQSIILPLVNKLTKEYDITILPYSKVTSIGLSADEDNKINSITYSKNSREKTLEDVDACVLAVGAQGLKSIMTGSPQLSKISPELTRASSLNSIGCISVRIWLDKVVRTRSPANVFSRFEELRGSGGTFFMLDQLQGNTDELWGAEKDSDKSSPSPSPPRGSVVACDFYNAGGLLSLDDETILSILKDKLLPSAVPAFKSANVLDFHVQRYPSAVSWFSPGSYKSRPPLKVPTVSNLVCAGDWVRLGDREHGAKGLCQERAYVSGLEAANQLIRSGMLFANNSKYHDVIPIRDDEPQVKLGRMINKNTMQLLKPFRLDSFWVR